MVLGDRKQAIIDHGGDENEDENAVTVVSYVRSLSFTFCL